MIRDGSSTRRALTTASLDLASRGLIGFEASTTGLLGRTTELDIRTGQATSSDPAEQARLERVRARPMDAATAYLLQRLTGLGGSDGLIDAKKLLDLGSDVGQVQHQARAARRRAWLVHGAAGEGDRPVDGSRDPRGRARRRSC